MPVIVESPYAGDTDAEVERNVAYLRACLADCFQRGEAPFASHGLYTQPGVLRDRVPAERERGIRAGFAWRRRAARTVAYIDLGITDGMQRGLDDARNLVWQDIEYRTLGGVWTRGGAPAPVELDAHLVFCPVCGVFSGVGAAVDEDGCCSSCGATVCSLAQMRASLLGAGLLVVDAASLSPLPLE